MKHTLPTLLTAAMTFGIAGHASRADVNCQIDSPVPHEVFQRQSATSDVIRVSGTAPAGPVVLLDHEPAAELEQEQVGHQQQHRLPRRQ